MNKVSLLPKPQRAWIQQETWRIAASAVEMMAHQIKEQLAMEGMVGTEALDISLNKAKMACVKRFLNGEIA